MFNSEPRDFAHKRLVTNRAPGLTPAVVLGLPDVIRQTTPAMLQYKWVMTAANRLQHGLDGQNTCL